MKKVLAVAITAILFISIFAVFTNATYALSVKPNISIQPSQKAAEVGVPFSVDVVVANITTSMRVIGIQFRVKYDPIMLKPTVAIEGPFMQSAGNTDFILGLNDLDPRFGYNVLIGDLLLPDNNGVWSSFPNGTGTVATITFIPNTLAQSKPLPTTTALTLVDVEIVDDAINEVGYTVTNGIVQIGLVGLEIQPSPAYAVMGASFSVDVVANGLNPGQRVIGIQFRVKYDTSILKPTSVTEGPFMKSFGNTYFIGDPNNYDPTTYKENVLVGDLLLPDNPNGWSTFPNGSGTVATITFTVIAHPIVAPTTTSLSIVNNLIVNDNLDEVPSSVSSEVVNVDLPHAAALSVYPAISYALVGHQIVVSVTLGSLDAAWRTIGVQFRLCYDATMFEVVNVTEGSFMTDKRWNAYGTYFLYSVEVDPVYGSNILIGDLLLPDNNGVWAVFPSGFGLVATITLNPLHAMNVSDPPLTTTLSIKNDLIVNDDLGEVAHTTNDGVVNILPVQPTLSVNPSLVEAHAAGMIFSVNVDISELNTGWRAVGAGFKLPYDSSLLEVVNVTEGSFMKDPAWNLHGTEFIGNLVVDPVYGPSVSVGDLLLPDDSGNWAAFPTGNGTVATITFKVIGQGRGLGNPPLMVSLDLAEPQVINDNLDLIPLNVLGGKVRIYPTNIADINLDGKVDMKDIGLVARAFGAYPGHPRWNASYDVVIDNIINMKDVGVVARNFGWQAS